jgi:hypothetical protein
MGQTQLGLTDIVDDGQLTSSFNEVAPVPKKSTCPNIALVAEIPLDGQT